MAYKIRVYSSASHAHLLEEGHKQVVNPRRGYIYLGGAAGKNGYHMGRRVKRGRGIGRPTGRVRGRYVFDRAGEQFRPTFIRHAEETIDSIIAKI